MTVISAKGISERLPILDSRSIMVYDGNNVLYMYVLKSMSCRKFVFAF